VRDDVLDALARRKQAVDTGRSTMKAAVVAVSQLVAAIQEKATAGGEGDAQVRAFLHAWTAAARQQAARGGPLEVLAAEGAEFSPPAVSLARISPAVACQGNVPTAFTGSSDDVPVPSRVFDKLLRAMASAAVRV
jgi:hypothetical protein